MLILAGMFYNVTILTVQLELQTSEVDGNVKLMTGIWS